MPAEVWRTKPARSISRCEAICASAGRFLQRGDEAAGQAHDRGPSFLECGRDPSGLASSSPDAAPHRYPEDKFCIAQKRPLNNSKGNAALALNSRDTFPSEQ